MAIDQAALRAALPAFLPVTEITELDHEVRVHFDFAGLSFTSAVPSNWSVPRIAVTANNQARERCVAGQSEATYSDRVRSLQKIARNTPTNPHSAPDPVPAAADLAASAKASVEAWADTDEKKTWLKGGSL